MSDTASATPTKDAIDHAGGAAFDPSRPHRTRDGREVMGLKPHLQGLTGRLQGEDTNHWWHLNGRFFLAKEDCLDLVNDPASPVTPLDERGGGDAEPVAINLNPQQCRSLIDAERARQKHVEGWTEDHDDQHAAGELMRAGMTYLWHDTANSASLDDTGTPIIWPWSSEWWKPKNRLANLIRAGALFLAENDRLSKKSLVAKPDITIGYIQQKLDIAIREMMSLPVYIATVVTTPAWLPSILSRHGSLGLPEDPREAVGVLVDNYAAGGRRAIGWLAGNGMVVFGTREAAVKATVRAGNSRDCVRPVFSTPLQPEVGGASSPRAPHQPDGGDLAQEEGRWCQECGEFHSEDVTCRSPEAIVEDQRHATPAPGREDEDDAAFVPLGDCEPGPFETQDGELGFKSEYRTAAGAVEAYCFGSGEFFWGGTSKPAAQIMVRVRSVELARRTAAPEPAALAEAKGVTEAEVEAAATKLCNRRGFGFYTDPMEGGQDAYDISCEALEDARDALEAARAVLQTEGTREVQS